MKLSTFNFQLSTRSGFTLIELMVTLAIFTIMTGIVLANYPDFNTKISRDVLVQNVALAIREAQVHGISIRSQDIGTLATAYGVYINDTQSYPLFSDNDSDNIYDSGDLIVPGNNNLIQGGKNKILLVCGNYHYTNNSGPAVRTDCEDAAKHPENLATANTSKELNIVFHRPNPEAIITGTLKEGINQCDSSGDVLPDLDGFCRYNNAAIFIGDGLGTYKKVIIWNTGQIATE
ncbi:MAG: type II secretion system protein [Candidatus Paceibacterota bacterium]|jgi:prepilin-type N-terminal cleavage/methylation domain-containing protein